MLTQANNPELAFITDLDGAILLLCDHGGTNVELTIATWSEPDSIVKFITMQPSIKTSARTESTCNNLPNCVEFGGRVPQSA